MERENIVLEEEQMEEGAWAEEAQELWYAMKSKITEAVELGVFTEKEANDWEEGFEACEQLEHMESLIEIIDDFVASGLSVMTEISASLDTDLLNDEEKRRWQSYAEGISFQDKCDLLEDLSAILHEVAEVRKSFYQVLQQKNLTREKAKTWEEQFSSADSLTKEGVLSRVASVEDKGKAEDQRQTLTFKIRDLILQEQFTPARKMLWTESGHFLNSAEKQSLSLEIDQAEIIQVRKYAQVA